MTFVNDLDCISIADIKRMIVGGTYTVRWTQRGEQVGSIRVLRNEASVDLIYRTRLMHSVNWENVFDSVFFIKSPCNLGGFRIWFKCNGCSNKVGKLYSGKRFRCRKCLDLKYEYLGPIFSKWDQGNAISNKLAGHFVPMGHSFPPRPIGMHLQTYQTLRDKHDRLKAPYKRAQELLGWMDERERSMVLKLWRLNLEKKVKREQDLERRKRHKRLKPGKARYYI